jgi:hypothetical protein
VALVAAPLAAAIHGAAVALADPTVFVNAVGEPSPLASAGYAVAYAVLGLIGLWQLGLVARAVVVPHRRGAQGNR